MRKIRKPSLEEANLPPPSRWPIKKGTRVWALSTRMAVGYPAIVSGRVVFYNAAKVGTILTTQGRPFYRILVAGGGMELVHTENMFPYTFEGLVRVNRLMVKHYEESAAYHREQCAEAEKRAYAFARQARKAKERKSAAMPSSWFRN